jgi:hypothetical protein
MHRSSTTAIFVTCLMLFSSVAGWGQSGRRQKRPEAEPPIQGVNRPETRTQSEPIPLAEEQVARQKGPGLLLMTGTPDVMIPLFLADAVTRGCLEELRPLLRGDHDLREERNQNRSDAIKAAKTEEGYYVLLLEVEADRVGTSRTGVEVRYTIFEPKTGKVVGSGMGFPTQPTGGMSAPPIGASRQQVLLDWVGRDIARQVVRRLGWRV